MPVRFLTEAERSRMGGFPAEVPDEDRIRFFTLSTADLDRVGRHRGDHNRLGFALQLCALRYLGFCPDDLTTPPSDLVTFVAGQLGLSPEGLARYGEREHTRTDHLQEIQEYLGFRGTTPKELEALTGWLIERALEHDKPGFLLQGLVAKLYTEKWVRPGVTRLERMVARAREGAWAETYRKTLPLLSEERCVFLDRLLLRDETIGRTRLEWLRQEATANTPRAMRHVLEKLAYLRRERIPEWDLSALNPNRRKLLAQLGRKSTNQALQRMPVERRYPVLLAFLHQAVEDRTDESVDLFDRYLSGAYARAGRELKEIRQSTSRASNEKVRLFRELGRVVLDPAVTDERLRAAIFALLPRERLEAAVADCDRLIRPLDDHYFDLLARRYTALRSFVPAFLEGFTFGANRASESLLEAVRLLRRMNESGKRKVPEEAPVAFVSAKWEPYVSDPEGRIDRRFYELCVLWELRGALRAGDIWVEGSRRYADPRSYLLPEAEWERLRPEVCRQVQAPEAGTVRIRQRREELEELLSRMDRELPRNEHVRIAAGEVIVSPISAEELPPSAVELRHLVGERLPRVELADLLIEVDRWTRFTDRFGHARGSEPRTADLSTHLYAAVLAQACNFGLTTMAELADLSYRRLAWCTDWYLREETLRAANTAIVNHHHRHPLSRHWGGGNFSSSDGQRFASQVANRQATALPRYFGYGRGLTFYTWTSDQYSQYGTKVIPATVRDATYVLDEILDNETELPIESHTTDTAGYTELVFALFDLLGLQFAPRIRDLGDQQLYRPRPDLRYRTVEPLLKGTIRETLIETHWDDLLRVAGSLKLGWVTASLLIGKLQSSPRQNALTRALQEYGRLIKTLFILRYLESREYRRQIHAQLNKGEALHALRRFLFFAHDGQLRQRQSEDQNNQAACLNLVTNAVITWNTVYIGAVVEQLRAEGHEVREADLEHLSPARYEHLNPYGKYRFHLEEGYGPARLRPLRPPQAQPS